jgi:hypothetical protein
MNDIIRLLVILILLLSGLSAYFLVWNALFSGRVTRTASIAQSMPGRSFGIGLVNFLFFFAIAVILFSLAENAGPFVRGVLTLPALSILGLLAIALSFGLTAMATLTGGRIFPESEVWRQTLWGSVLLALACALPFVGWFLLLPYVGFIGIGAWILGFIQRDVKS